MKKKVLSALLVAAMTATMFAGCGSGDDSASTGGDDAANTQAPADDGGAEDDGSSTPEVVDYGSGNITIWVAEEVSDFTQQKAEEFLKSDEAYSGYTVSVEPVGEGDAAGNMITDVEGGADIYGFAQDQLTRLVSAGALQPVVGEYQSWIAENNDEGSVSATQVGDMTYAFPMTSDNGYFLYYDKSVITDPTSLEQIVADCEAAGKNFYFEINSGWYQPAFFFGTGCTLTYDTDADGNFTACNIDYNSDKGLVALKEIIELASSKSFQNGSSIDKATNMAAIVDGTWDSGAAKSAFGDNYACAKLPGFTGSDGSSYQLGGFGGFKLIGIKPQTEEGKLALCYKLAQYLTSEEVQTARYESVGWGPSNKAAQSSDAVQSDEALSALAEQLAISIPQGQYPGDYWTLATSLGDTIISGDLSTSTSDDDLMKTLEDFQNTCIGYAQ
ncbi:MAG: extracellular solute-binding protein [Muribaculaceae bacterium]|nr:extracellular solute-binding protein [Roseburia sp.]MCM1431413.1 extracellular solute-binding protein [Muribaculaceae bacterium]MCM1491855.1 extracellular solute-binding protein [Muribaculaceae bacterium]